MASASRYGASVRLQTRAGEVLDRTKVQKQNNSRNVIMSYHYFTGLGANGRERRTY